MTGTITLTLADLRFYAYHGWFAEEARQGQSFLVDLWVSYPEPDQSIATLDQTIDYTIVHSILKEQMERPRRLLEDLAQSILGEIKQQFPLVTHQRIHIQKLAPPVSGLDGRLGIQVERNY